MTQRDEFFEALIVRAETDDRVFVLADDFTCEMFKRFQHRFPARAVNTGPMEQTAVDVAIGMAVSGMLPVVFGIAPFIVHRAQEGIWLAGLMKLNVTLVGVGAGESYEEAGPTHHGTEDYASARVLPNVTVWTCSDGAMARFLVSQLGNGVQYFRLDRQELPCIHPLLVPELIQARDMQFEQGYWWHTKQNRDATVVISHGYGTHFAIERYKQEKWDHVEIMRYPIAEELRVELERYSIMYSSEENSNRGGLYSACTENLSKTYTGRGIPYV